MRKYIDAVQEFLENPELANREFQCDSQAEMKSCYASIWNWKKRHQAELFLFCNADEYKVIISKEPMTATMEFKDNVDTSAYEQRKLRYGSKYTKIFTDFLESDGTNREVLCNTPTQTRSCRDSMARLIKNFELQDTVRVTYDIRRKTVLLTRKGGPIHV